MFNKSFLKKTIQPYEIEEIKYLEAKKCYTKLYFNSGIEILLCHHLMKIQKVLSDYEQFVRIHRSYIVNNENILQIEFDKGFLRLNSGEVIPISKIYFD